MRATTTTSRETLRIPGPTPVPPEVMAAMQWEMMPHRGEAFQEFYLETLRLARLAHRTESDVLIFPGSGSAGWEAAIVNLFSPGDMVVAAICGDFGARFAKVAATFGLDVRRLDVPWGEPVLPDAVNAALDAAPGAKALLVAYNETSTALMNPIEEIAKVVRAHDALIIVDAVSAAGGLPMEVDVWGLDLVLSGSQKAWMCPPGLMLTAIGPRAWEAYERSTFPRFFWDFGTARDNAAKGMSATTAPLTMLYALRGALEMIQAEGLENVWDRHRRLATNVRTAITERGFELFPNADFASNTLTGVRPPHGMAARDVVKAVRERHGIEFEAGKGPIIDDIVRLGHMGWVHQPELEIAVSALLDVLETAP
ncbi:MAG: pyridoxal-phosphate-dependent aminotransferase family protein [Thermomicrobiales bacterium]